MPKEVTNQAFGLVDDQRNSQIANQVQALDGTKFGYTEKFASETMAGVLSRFSFTTATTIQELKNSPKNENMVKSTEFWLSVWKKWCLEKSIAKEIENYKPAELNTLLEGFYAEIKKSKAPVSQLMNADDTSVIEIKTQLYLES